jgi:hypothetical protein
MIYTVVWVPNAIDQLADHYNRATDRQAIT